MSQELTPKPARPWRDIAQEASQEPDPARMLRLIQELNQALDEQGLAKLGGANVEKKTA